MLFFCGASFGTLLLYIFTCIAHMGRSFLCILGGCGGQGAILLCVSFASNTHGGMFYSSVAVVERLFVLIFIIFLFTGRHLLCIFARLVALVQIFYACSRAFAHTWRHLLRFFLQGRSFLAMDSTRFLWWQILRASSTFDAFSA